MKQRYKIDDKIDDNIFKTFKIFQVGNSNSKFREPRILMLKIKKLSTIKYQSLSTLAFMKKKSSNLKPKKLQ